MTDTTQTPPPSTSGGDTPRRRFFWFTAAATAIAALAAGIGTRAFAHSGYCGWHRGGFMGATSDPAAVDAHLDHALRHLYVEIDATDAQKQQLAPIVKGAAHDLLPIRAKVHDARRQAIELLSQPNIDRAALETLRADQLKLVEAASQRLTQALSDVADVLTPEQKQRLAEHINSRHGHHE